MAELSDEKVLGRMFEEVTAGLRLFTFREAVFDASPPKLSAQTEKQWNELIIIFLRPPAPLPPPPFSFDTMIFKNCDSWKTAIKKLTVQQWTTDILTELNS